MLNWIWLGLLVFAVVIGGINGSLNQVTEAGIERAESAVMELALPLAGIMALWLGMMRLAERAGLIQALARALKPLMRRLFPDVPPEHPAMGSMITNIAANMLGLANAATPLGLRAMKDLETLNRRAGTASNAMCTFLALNTSSVQLLPLTAIAVLAAKGSATPSAIVAPALMATLCSTIAGITAVKWLERWRMFQLPSEPAAESTGGSDPQSGAPPSPTVEVNTQPLARWGKAVMLVLVGFFVWLFIGQVTGAPDADAIADHSAFIRVMNAISMLALPFLFSFLPLYAALKRVKVYEDFVEGAKEGFQVSIRIIPYLVAIFVAIGMFRAAGGIELVTRGLGPLLDAIGFPTELVPMCLMRPLSGSGTLAVFADLVTAHGADSLLARIGGSIFGSTETTFYVVAVYFGSVGIRRTRHAVPAGLFADLIGIIASVVICRLMFS